MIIEHRSASIEAISVARLPSQVLAEELGVAKTPPELQLRSLLAAFPGLQQRWEAAWATCERRGWVATAAGRRFSFSPASLKDVKVRWACHP